MLGEVAEVAATKKLPQTTLDQLDVSFYFDPEGVAYLFRGKYFYGYYIGSSN